MDPVEATFTPSLTAPRDAREFLRSALATQSLDGLGEVSELLATELVANVVRHVGSDATVRVSPTRDGVRVEVDDASTDVPVLQLPDRSSPSGRGILLLDSFATRWGADVRLTGKTVWFEVHATTATREVHGRDR